MLGAGLEPAWGCPPGFLRPLRIPFRHPSRADNMPRRAARRATRLCSGAMPIPRSARAAALVGCLVVPPLAAQLPTPTAPVGVLRLEFGGAFHPTDAAFVDGSRRLLGARFGDALGATATPLVGDLETRLAPLLGRPATPASLGGLRAVAEQQRGVATIALGYGLTRRLTLTASLPLVSTRTQIALTPTGDGATLGANPADPLLGDAGGAAQTTAFFTQFGAALTTLADRIADGAYAGDPATLALAQQTLAGGEALRGGLQALLADPATASAVLPTTASPDGAALLDRIGALQGTLGGALGVGGFTALPALPADPLGAAGVATLLTHPRGFGYLPTQELPRTALGDLELGATMELIRRGAPGDAQWFALWGQAVARLGTGTAADPRYLLDQGSGDGQTDVDLAMSVELGRGRFGLRAEGAYTLQLAGTLEARIGAREQLLLPASRTATIHRNPGDVVRLTVRPFYRIVPHLAVTGLAQVERRGRDAVRYADGGELPGVPASLLADGSAADAVRVGLGLSYAHDGVHRDGAVRMPVEAGFSLERTIASGRGVMPTPLTTRIMLRVYKPIRR